ncbi:MAG: ATP-binding protein [Bacteroidales bacterium]|nr:ATP-binding protein [Bacteroidales bacterium]
MEAKGKIQFVLDNKVDELSLLSAKVETMADLWDFSDSQTMNLNLVLEEAISNILFYAFDDDSEQKIYLILEYDDETLSVEIMDSGKPFDPTRQGPPDITLPAEERSIGGLGIFLINKLMDHVEYCRKENMNMLTLKKRIK